MRQIYIDMRHLEMRNLENLGIFSKDRICEPLPAFRQVDLLIYCLYNIKPTALVSVLQAKSKGRFRRLLASEGARLRKAQPLRLASLASDFSNLAQVAVQLGYPEKLLMKGEVDKKATAASMRKGVPTPTIDDDDGDDASLVVDTEDGDEEQGALAKLQADMARQQAMHAEQMRAMMEKMQEFSALATGQHSQSSSAPALALPTPPVESQRSADDVNETLKQLQEKYEKELAAVRGKIRAESPAHKADEEAEGSVTREG